MGVPILDHDVPARKSQRSVLLLFTRQTQEDYEFEARFCLKIKQKSLSQYTCVPSSFCPLKKCFECGEE